MFQQVVVQAKFVCSDSRSSDGAMDDVIATWGAHG